MDKSDYGPDPVDSVLLEAVELELALQSAMPFENGCENAVCEALARSGGALLFLMRPDVGEPDHWVGVVFFGADDETRMGLVTISEKKRTVAVETLERSKSPLARIAPAYAAVLTQLQAAA
ncbi:MAG: hypothetical protein JJ913_14100 [Rhizobiaceae bacterium]|nr:hypothetical protein [Rhizobiaceae bacterium]